MITVYTDASASSQYTCAAYMIINFEKGIYLCSGTHNYTTSKSNVTEICAIRDALKVLIDNYDVQNEDVTVFTDFEFAQVLWYKYKRNEHIRSHLFNEIIQLSMKFKSFNIKHVTSHVGTMSPNKACDILARSYR